MTEFTSRKGIVRDVDLDLDAICAYEQDHPDWSLITMTQKMDECMRFSDLDLIVRFLGFTSLKEFIDEGFSVGDMAEMVGKSSYMGFMDSPSAGE